MSTTKRVEGVGRGDYYRVTVSSLRIRPGFNQREDYGDMESLYKSVKANKRVLQPLIGSKEGDVFFIDEGHRRYEAMKMVLERDGLEVEAIFISAGKQIKEEERYFGMLVRNEDGKPFTILEQSNVIGKLLPYGYTEKTLPAKLGKSDTHIRNLIRLWEAPEELKNLIRANIISSTDAILQLKEGTAEQFLVDVQAGKYDKAPEQTEIFDKPTTLQPSQIAKGDVLPDATASQAIGKPSKQAAIRRKDREKAVKGPQDEPEVNSWSELKKFLKSYDGTPADPTKATILAFAARVVGNEYTVEGFQRYFSTPAKATPGGGKASAPKKAPAKKVAKKAAKKK